VLTLQKNQQSTVAEIKFDQPDINNLLGKEWLLTNSRGGYSSSTVAGCNTRRYHSLLVGSLNPPVNRIAALANCLEMVIFNNDDERQVFELSTFEFGDTITPKGFNHLKAFRQDTGVHFDYEFDGLKLTKSIYLLADCDTIAVSYDFKKLPGPVKFTVRPFAALRDFHSLQKSYASLCSEPVATKNNNKTGLIIRHDTPGSCELLLKCPDMEFEKDPQWWFNFLYRQDKERGQDFEEDLWTPGFYKASIDSPRTIVFWANLSQVNSALKSQWFLNGDIKAVRKNLSGRRKTVTKIAGVRDKTLQKLYLAADAFISERKSAKDKDTPRKTILAGFPWFADWGRDAFISLPGLLLETGRFEDAKSILVTFAASADDGMIANRFDDFSNTACFNSIDASLWFINAAFLYLEATGDTETFTSELLPTIRWIVDCYQRGTRFSTHADDDGLITAGDADTQLTWMDAKYEDVVFTPRHGKAVEINALWYNGLCWLAQFYTDRDSGLAQRYHSMADKVQGSFCKLFWNENKGCLNDCVLPDGSVDSSLRPNQIFAVSLPFSPLSPQQRAAVVSTIEKTLLTPYGLRTLSPAEPNYKPVYTGPQSQRDAAYHQGTVWPFLIGPFVEAYLKVNDFDRKSKKTAAGFIQPLLDYMADDGCLGQVCEVFDADPPQRPKGCIAQAWSIAELIRAYKMINT